MLIQVLGGSGVTQLPFGSVADTAGPKSVPSGSMTVQFGSNCPWAKPSPVLCKATGAASMARVPGPRPIVPISEVPGSAIASQLSG